MRYNRLRYRHLFQDKPQNCIARGERGFWEGGGVGQVKDRVNEGMLCFIVEFFLNIEVCTIKVFDEQRTTRTNTNKIFELFFSAIFANICHIIREKSLIFLPKIKILFNKTCASPFKNFKLCRALMIPSFTCKQPWVFNNHGSFPCNLY